MNNAHRLFLQSLISRKVMKDADAKEFYKRACEKYEVDMSQKTFDDFIRIINRNLEKFSLEIRKGISEDNGTPYRGLVNTSDDQHVKMATDYSPNDVQFFKKVLDALVQSPNGTVASIDLVHAGAELEKRMGPSQAEDLLLKFTKDGWLAEDEGCYWLSIRSLLELGPYLRRVYQGDVLICSICSDIVMKGQSCESCGIKVHAHCAARFFSGNQRSNPKCPSKCGEDWVHEIPRLPESSSRETPPQSQQVSRSRAGPSRGRRR